MTGFSLKQSNSKGFDKVRFEPAGHLQHVAIRSLEGVLSFTLKTVSGNFAVNPYWLPPVQFMQKGKVQDPHPTLVPLPLLSGPLFLTLMVPRAPSPMTRKA